MIRVLLADDHEIVRLGLRSVLEEAEDIKVVAEVATAEGAIAAAQAGGIDVILMDLRFGAGAEGQRVTTGAQATAATSSSGGASLSRYPTAPASIAPRMSASVS